jgi:phosphoribosyl 1,2-cyclic phosphate phosphodiesterase
MTGALEVVIMGCGASGGVPRADGDWGVCNPSDPRNRRSRCSLLVRRLSDGGPDSQTTVIVDAAPEFRQQAVAAQARRLDALLLTHDHADQCHGLDDIRAFAMTQKARIPCWADRPTTETLSRRFGYIFEGGGLYPPIAQLHEVPSFGQTFRIDGPSGEISVFAFDQDHGPIRSLGYRFGALAYSSDVVDLPDTALAMLQDLDVWIVDALRYRPHPTHAHVAKALEWIDKVKPKRAILTNMHVDLDYRDLAAQLPSHVEPAFDGLRLQLAG